MAHFTRRTQVPAIRIRRRYRRDNYRVFKPYVREDFRQQCAYCLVAELWSGGEANFGLDHFIPKSLCSKRLNDFYNLYYACNRCNHCKDDAWPPQNLLEQGIGFVNLCEDEFSQHFRLLPDGTCEGLTPKGQYTIDMLQLNRNSLVAIREFLIKMGFPLRKGITAEGQLRQFMVRLKEWGMDEGEAGE